MREDYKKYYRDDIDAQKEVSKSVRFFTTEGYARLNALIANIRSGDKVAENEFMEIIQPWAEDKVERACIHFKTDETIDQKDLLAVSLMKSLQQLRTDKNTKTWKEFSPLFSLILGHQIISLRRSAAWDQQKYERSAGSALIKPQIDARLRNDELSDDVTGAVLKLSPDDDLLLAYAYGARSTSNIAASLGMNRSTVKSKTARLSGKLFDLARRHPSIREWLDEHKISDTQFFPISPENIDAVNIQKEKIRALFGFPETKTLWSIAQQLEVHSDASNFFFGNSMTTSAALSDNIKARMSGYLRAHGKENGVEMFEEAFDAIRALVGHKTKKRGGAPDPAGVTR